MILIRYHVLIDAIWCWDGLAKIDSYLIYKWTGTACNSSSVCWANDTPSNQKVNSTSVPSILSLGSLHLTSFDINELFSLPSRPSTKGRSRLQLFPLSSLTCLILSRIYLIYRQQPDWRWGGQVFEPTQNFRTSGTIHMYFWSKQGNTGITGEGARRLCSSCLDNLTALDLGTSLHVIKGTTR